MPPHADLTLSPALFAEPDFCLASPTIPFPPELGESPKEEPARVGLRAAGSLYNLVKAAAKEINCVIGAERLRVAATKGGGRLDAKNSKGSTALHACAYLRRWDLAQVLLDAGANPLAKNAAGHTFFLTAVKDPVAPWEALFAAHSKLLEKHRQFLSRTGDRSERPARPAREAQGKLRTEGESWPASPSRGSAPMNEARSALFEEGLWAEFEAETKLGQTAAFLGSDEGWVRCLAEAGPGAVYAAVGCTGLLRAPHARKLAERAIDENWVDDAWTWIRASGPQLTFGEQKDFMRRAWGNRAIPLMREMARRGWIYDEYLVEDCEEAEEFDFADLLVDLSASPPPPLRPVFAGGASSKSVQNGGLAAKSGNKVRRSMKGAGGKARGARGSKDRKPSSMIADLDRPAKEANDYEYKEKKPLAKAPLIIVKKARLAAPLGDL